VTLLLKSRTYVLKKVPKLCIEVHTFFWKEWSDFQEESSISQQIKTPGWGKGWIGGRRVGGWEECLLSGRRICRAGVSDFLHDP
jgi:hypothetical protein